MTPSYDGIEVQDLCAWKFCRGLFSRSEMKRIPGRRGYFCTRCYNRMKNIPKSH
jgi:hypothetical protein